MTFFAIWQTIKGAWQVYAGVALLAAFWLYGNYQYNAGRAVEIARFEQAADEARIASIEAAASADVKQQERATEFNAVQETLTEEIENAKSDDRNALDSIFGSM